MSRVLEIQVNGRRVSVDTDAGRPLLSVLRDDLDMTGTKYGCGEGQCGACTVVVDGAAVRSCITPVGSLAGKEILTIEGLERDGRLHPVQQAFMELDAIQCGYCTPGMIMSAYALLRRNPRPTDQQIVQSMDGNVCRCCVYPRIVAAVRKAAGGERA
jgi:aerobic-type carbon monoxide dehydrogenase small subunit (CoxS/CutS family)